MRRRKRTQSVRTDRVGLLAAVPLVFVVAFGTALANRVGATCVDYLIEISEPVVDYIEDIMD
jgi:hypothetical protein